MCTSNWSSPSEWKSQQGNGAYWPARPVRPVRPVRVASEAGRDFRLMRTDAMSWDLGEPLGEEGEELELES